MSAAKSDMRGYCETGFLPYHYGSVGMLPIYAAAGSELAFGHYCQDGQVLPFSSFHLYRKNMLLSSFSPGPLGRGIRSLIQY